MKRLLPRPAPVRKRPSRAKPKPAPAAEPLTGADPAAAPPPPETTHVSRHNAPEPQLPHEHEQSSASQARAPEQDPRPGCLAAADVARGLVDTDRGPVLERLHDEHFKSADSEDDDDNETPAPRRTLARNLA